MTRTRFADEQIIGILAEQDAGAKGAELCREQGMSEGAFLRLEGRVRRHDSVGSAAAEDA